MLRQAYERLRLGGRVTGDAFTEITTTTTITELKKKEHNVFLLLKKENVTTGK
jgi:hypothetical protein